MQTAIEHDSRIPQRTETRLFLKTILEVNRQILQGNDYKKILEFIFESLDLQIPYDRIGVALLDEEAEDEPQMRMSWVKSKVPIHYLNLPYTANVVSERLYEIMHINKPRIINDIRRYLMDHPTSETSKLLLQDGILSNLTCPLRFDGKAIGVVFFSSCESNVYNESHINKALQIADEISLIVNYGQLQEMTASVKKDRSNLHMTLHDLKSPLNTLQGFAQLSIKEDWFKKLDTDARKVFQIFFRNTKYMSELVNDLNEINLLKCGSQKVSRQIVDVNEFCQEMFKMGQSIAASKKIHFELIISALPQEPACFEPHKISRVLNNLFSNAVKFSNRGSTVEFLVDAHADRLTFSVRDHGLGIPASELPDLFKEFGKTSVRPTEGESSSGQGLAIVKKIVKRSGGKISVTSEPGKGSTFSFWIPIRAENA